jgi:alpha-mannosidase
MKYTLSFVLLCFLAHVGRAGIVFQIGAPDGDYKEFALAGNYQGYAGQFPNDVNFVVGKSDPARDWPYILPGPADAWAGHRSHTFTIHFQAPAAASNICCRLSVDFVSTHDSAPPLLAIGINGEKIGRLLPKGSTEEALSNPRAGKNCSIQQLIPAALFHAGDNTITLSSDSGSWALFDDVRLESGVAAPEKTLSMAAAPVPFFKHADSGLQRAVNISIDNLAGGSAPAELTWTSAAGSGSQKFDLHFGPNDFQILAPDTDQIELALRTAQREIKMPVPLPPAKKWRLFIVPTAHTDIGYTDLQERVRQRHADNGLKMLDWLKEYPDMKWYFETFWQLNALLELHPEKTNEVFARLREKRMGLSGDYANMLTGLCSSEALNRVTLDSRNLANRGGFELNSVILDDVPSAISTLPMVLAHSGIKYFIEGANNDRAPYAGNVPNPFYWEGVDGSRVLADITTKPGYGGANRLLPSLKGAMEQLPPYLARFETNDYPYDAILINGAYGDNHEVQDWLPKVVRQWNAEWEYPKMIFALPEDFYGYIEKNFSNDIPVLKTDFGGWWEDGAGSSALETELSRRAEERAVSAEMLHSLAGMLTGASYPKTNFDDVWHNILLYNEHTWGAARSIREPDSEQTVQQWAVKSSFAHGADTGTRELLKSGMNELAAIVPAADLVVFNQLAWRRNALVTTETTNAAAQDVAAGKIFPCQPLPEGGSCFVAEDLPSIGYRSYRNDVSLNQPVPDAVQISGNQVENEFYRVTLNPKTGGIKSIFDKQAGRELVDSNSEYNLGELIYVTGGEGTYAVHSDLKNLPPPKFEYHPQTGTGIEKINGPVFGELASDATAENFPSIKMRVRLYRGLKQLDLIYELDKTETTNKEAVYLAFPFALDASKGGLWLEYPDEITEPLKDQHASACRDWYSVQRWLAVSDGRDTVEISPLDAPLFTLGGMTASTWPRELSLKRGHVFAYLMNNYWHTNYKARQGGHFVFRYSLTSGAGGFSKGDAVVKGWNMFCPAVAQAGQGAHQPVISAAAKSLVSVEPAGLPLTTIKEAEDKNGFVFRCCDYAGLGGTAKLLLTVPARQVFGCNLVETGAHDLNERGQSVTLPIEPFAPETIKVQFAP